MGVNVQRGGGLLMTEKLLNLLDSVTTVDQQASGCMAKIVEREYSLRFADDVQTQAFLYYFASDSFYFWMIGVSGLLAFPCFPYALSVLSIASCGISRS